MIYGVDYYPEHWDRSEWEHQAELMKEGGFNTVRMGEFDWKLFEKEEGKFDFSILDDAVEVLASKGIKVILGTPTAAPPKWLADRYDVLQRDRYGRVRAWGSRRECCANSRDYIEKSAVIVKKMVKHFAGNRNVIGWQIDNEFGCHASTRCYCENCRRAFAKWLKKRYEDIDSLNKTWGNVFWSLDYDSFEDVILPAYNSCEGENYPNFAHNPSLDLEYRRFASDSWVKYQRMQVDIIRKYSDLPITHNFMGHFSDIDYYKLGRDLDYVAWDNYPDNQWGGSEYQYVSMAHENMRGIKNKNFIVMEEQAGPCGWDVVGRTPEPGQLRLWAYQAIAHGCEGLVYFRFRTALFGMEQYWYGVLDHDGIPRRRFYEIKQTGEELKKLEEHIAGVSGDYEALIYKSYDDVWSHEIKRHKAGFDYRNLLYAYYKANSDLNVTAAVSDSDFSKYKVVYMPAHNVVTGREIKKLEEYVENGGMLVLTYRSGTRDYYNNMRATTVPGAFAKLAGIEVSEFSTPDGRVKLEGDIFADGCGIAADEDSATGRLWCDIIEPKGAKVLARYAEDYYKGKAAITVNEYGRGKVYYAGCDMDGNTLKTFVKYISEGCGITTSELPEGVELVKRADGCMFLLNHNRTACETEITGTNMLTGEVFDGRIEGYGAYCIKKHIDEKV